MFDLDFFESFGRISKNRELHFIFPFHLLNRTLLYVSNLKYRNFLLAYEPIIV